MLGSLFEIFLISAFIAISYIAFVSSHKYWYVVFTPQNIFWFTFCPNSCIGWTI